jgi:hypothetical protein
MTNFQDVLRDVHDASSHALKTTASLGASTVYVGNPTLYAVVNTSAAGDSTNNIGFATVSVSNPTLYAVVNTSAPGVSNSIVTVANTPLSTQIVGNVTLSGPIPTGANWVGLATVWTANAQTNTGNVTLNTGPNQIGSVTVSNTVSTAQSGTWNVGLSAGSNNVGDVDVASIAAGDNNIGNVDLASAIPTGLNWVGFATVTTTNPGSSSGNVTINPGPNQIGSVTVSNPITIGNSMVTVTLGTKLDSTNDSVSIGTPTVFVGTPTLYAVVNTSAAGDSTANIGFATVSISNPTLYAVVNTGAAGVGNSIVTIANTPLDTRIIGNVTLSDAKTFVGLVSVSGFTTPLPVSQSGTWTVQPGNTANTTPWLVSAIGNVTLSDSKTFVGLVSVSGFANPMPITDNSGSLTVDGSVGVAGNVTLSDSKTFIGLVTAWNRNAGTTKTLTQLPVGLGNNSLSTIAIPTNAQRINATQMIFNSNVTTEIAIKSGVTYLTGNATLGVTLFPGGGFVMNGSPDSPVWISLPSGAMVVEKRDIGGTVSKIAGHVIYFDE